MYFSQDWLLKSLHSIFCNNIYLSLYILPYALVDILGRLYFVHTDLAWYQDLIFWTSEDGELFMYDGESTKVMDFVSDASCIAVDWLGEKLYWSVFKNGVVCF